MGDKTGISWTDSTWNAIVGCSIVSPACTNCYAMAQAARIERMREGSWRKMGVPIHDVPEGRYTDTTKIVNGKPVWTGVLKQAPEETLTQPLRWKRPRRIFVNSMSDLFHEAVPDEWIDRVFAVMALAPQHTYQILTKRPKRMRAYIEAKRKHAPEWVEFPSLGARVLLPYEGGVPRYVWLGVTAEDQTRADERIPELLATPAAVRFVSVEPMLGPVDLRMTRYRTGCPRCDGSGSIRVGDTGGRMCPDCEGSGAAGDKLDWVICGSESGPNARPMRADWARSLRDQCKAAGVPFFMKQMHIEGKLIKDVAGFPEDLRVQEFPNGKI